MIKEFDFLVIGSGIAGMSFALKVAHKGKVALICKTELEEANTFFAQGGIASVTNTLVDNFDKHIEDTMIAGDWISDRAAVEKVVREAPGQIKELIDWGVDFDKNDKGDFDLHKEGGHSEFRILHHKDNTGAEIQESLIRAVKTHPNIEIFNRHFAVEIITQHHMGIIVTRHTPGIKCYGAYVLNEDTGEVDTFLSKVTLMATGGVGAVYRNTTNPLVATGDGIAMVYRAKGFVQDMEFIQFHPTALYHPGARFCRKLLRFSWFCSFSVFAAADRALVAVPRDHRLLAYIPVQPALLAYFIAAAVAPGMSTGPLRFRESFMGSPPIQRPACCIAAS